MVLGSSDPSLAPRQMTLADIPEIMGTSGAQACLELRAKHRQEVANQWLQAASYRPVFEYRKAVGL